MSKKNALPNQTSAPSKAVITAIKRLLRPLVRLLMSFQITLPFLVDLLKEVYVDVAEKDFPLDNKKQTDTRISMLTGVHRKDTKRLRNREREDDYSPETVSIGVQLVTKWLSDPQYLDEQGKPRLLALKASAEDEQADFEHLVQSVCRQDMRARVILDEWLRLGIASLHEDNFVRLDAEGFIPSKGVDEKAFYLGMNVSDHLEASTQNLLADQPPFLERCVYYDGLSESSIQQLEQAAREKGMALLQELNQQALLLKEHDLKDQGLNGQDLEGKELKDPQKATGEAEQAPLNRMNFGVYFYTQPEEKDDEQA